MRTLPASELLDVWERGERQHPLDMALTLLEATCPEKERAYLMHLSIGQRDALLLTSRRINFGPEMEALATCPACGAQLEFMIDTSELQRAYKPADSIEQTMDVDDYSITIRLPDSVDLAEQINSGSMEPAGEILERCVLKIASGEEEVPLEELPKSVASTLVERMAELDPLSEIWVRLNCSECEHSFTMLLDILSFYWKELRVQARKLLKQVHVLAGYYGWREADILAMKPWRRQYYLDMVT
ncbi:MAG: phage baseplate protein [Actinomycetota bacterium]|nr:phage baseplate protein [Actinomycetota bacterium]